MTTVRRIPFGGLPLFWKVLLPFLTLMVIVGAFGVFLIMRDLSSRAQFALDQDLARRSSDARATVRDRELYLLEAANFAANLQGMTAAAERRDQAEAARLLQSVVALKSDVTLFAVADRNATGLVDFTRVDNGATPSFARDTPWSNQPIVAEAIASGQKRSGVIRHGDRPLLAIAAPICPLAEACIPVGVAVVGISVDDIARAASGTSAGAEAASPTGIAIYDAEGVVIGSHGLTPEGDLSAAAKTGSRQRRHDSPDGEIETLYTPFEVQGQTAGTIAASVPTAPAFSPVRGAGAGLVGVVVVAMAGIVAIGALLSRSILGQVRPLVETNRALGGGDLAARAPVLTNDELGELAHGVNQMAEQLQASYETLELRVEQRTAEIRRLLQDRTEFFAGLSHELRTPLAVILLQAKSLLARSGMEEADIIKASAEELLQVVNDILDLAGAEAGAIDVDLRPVRVPDLVKELEPMLRSLAAGANVEMTVNVPRRLPRVIADPTRLRDVIVNLVDNAIKYTPRGGRVDVQASSDHQTVRIRVSDTGSGIAEKDLPRIFDRLYRGDQSRTTRGLGLGLSLVRAYVEAQGGNVAVTSTPGKGATFTISLPNLSPL